MNWRPWILFCLLLSIIEAKQLTTDGLPKRDPHFWEDGKTLTYTVETIGSHRNNVKRLNLEDGTSEFFFNGNNRNRSDRELKASKSGKAYAYNSVSGLSSRITYINQSLDLHTTMPNMGTASWCNWPTVSPNGRFMAFTEGATILYLYDSDYGKATTENLRRLTYDGATHSDLYPSFSPDGKHIVFSSNRDKDYEIYIMERDGSNQTRITQSPGIDRHPVFSPDGKHIAFTSNRDGNYEIYIMQRDGSNPQRITHHPERDDYCTWHPNSNDLVMVSERNGHFDLYLVNVIDIISQ